MSYPKQSSVADRLQTQSLDAMHALLKKRWTGIERLWQASRVQMRRHILETYQNFFAGKRWSLVGIKASGAFHVLGDGLRSMTAQFRDVSRQEAKNAVNDVYRESVLRHAWVLDQTTPPNVKVRIPNKLRLMEAGRQVAFYQGPEAVHKFGERWNAWADGYYTNLMTNLQLGAINESSPSDAADEVDATRVNTPAFGILDALQRMFAFETVYSMNRAASTVAGINEEADVEMIWETRRDLKVCDDCAENEGLTEEEVDGEIPAHPNCHCYWRMVPKSWADLLRSGDEGDYDLAVQMDARGIVPNAMVIKGENGQIAGYDTVEFGDWYKDRFHALVGQ